MNWNRIDSDWKDIKGNVVDHWGELDEDQLASRVRETYGVTNDEVAQEPADWQQRLSEIHRAA